MNKIKHCIVPLLALALMAGCGDDNDASEGARDTGSAKAQINFPDHFPTVSHKCYGTNGVYIASNRGETGVSSPFVLADDPKCST